jgi:hypothetical protein
MMKKINTRIIGSSLAAALSCMMMNNASADLVSGWGLETGGQAASLTEGVAGSFSVTQPTGNAEPRANLSSPIDFSSIGSAVQLSGSVTLSGSQALGNDSFRFGLYNNNSHSTGTLGGGLWTGADPVGWLGYMAEAQNGNGSGSSFAVGRNTSGSWFSGTGAYALTASPGEVFSGTFTGASPGTFSFDLVLTRLTLTSVNVAFSFVDTTGGAGNDYSVAGNFIDDNAGSSAGMTSFNEVGFLLNTSSGGAASFSDVSVAAVPEPTVLALCGLSLAGLLGARARRRK